jgi:four helix bundle protein
MSEGIKTYKDLFVWQKSIDLVKQIYIICKKFPDSEKFGMVSQMQRASVSIPTNIAEGWGRETRNYYINFLRVSKGSLAELETLSIIAKELNYIDEEAYIFINNKTEEVSRMLNALIRSLQ